MELERRRREAETEAGGVAVAPPAPVQFGGNADRCEALGLSGGGWARVGRERGGTGWFDGVDAAHGATDLTQRFDAVVVPGLTVTFGAGLRLVVGVGGEQALDAVVTNLGRGVLRIEAGVAVAGRAGLEEGVPGADLGAGIGAGVALRRTFEVPWPELAADPARLLGLLSSATVLANDAVETLLHTVVAGVDLNPYVVGDALELRGTVDAGAEVGAFGPEVEALAEVSSALGLAVTYDGRPDADGFRTGEVAFSVDLAGATELGATLARRFGLAVSLPSACEAGLAIVVGFEEHLDTKTFTSAGVRAVERSSVGEIALESTFSADASGEAALALAFTFPLGAPIASGARAGIAAMFGASVGVTPVSTMTATLAIPLGGAADLEALARAVEALARTGAVDASGLGPLARAALGRADLSFAVDVSTEVDGGLEAGPVEVGGAVGISFHEDDFEDHMPRVPGLEDVLAAIRAGTASSAARA